MIPGDERYMKKAIELAKKGEGSTSPNPVVGAVLVKGGKVVGRGYHRKAGLPHAEVEAINDAGKNAKGSTLYVTLEPCSTFGKTPPCTGLILECGIKNVKIAAKDPNPVNRGKGIKLLKDAEIDVEVGVLEKESREINRAFESFIIKKRPFVTVKVAQSLDGKIATATGESKWITGPDSRRYVHSLRSRVDAVLVGVNTVIKDDPLLTSRLYRKSVKQPVKIVLDSRLRTPRASRLFSPDSPGEVILVTTPSSPLSRRRFFQQRGVKVLIAKDKKGRVSLNDAMRRLAKMGIAHILVEGGSEVLGDFFREKLVDKVLFFISPRIIGGRKALSSVMGEGINRLKLAQELKDVNFTRFKEDFLIEGYLY